MWMLPDLDGELSAPAAGGRPGGSLAVFDLDRTLVPGSSLVPLGRALVKDGLLPGRVLARHALGAVAYEHRGEEPGTVGRLEHDLLAAVAGREHHPLAGVARRVGEALVPHMHPTARWLLDRHLDTGDFCVIVSASVHELVEAVAAAVGAHRGVGTSAEVVDGRLTGRLSGPLCHGSGKLARMRAELGDVDLRDAAAYADSHSDLPVLEAVGTAVAVNPDRRLQREARRRGWPTVRFPRRSGRAPDGWP